MRRQSIYKIGVLKFYFEDATERKSQRLKDRSITEAHDEAPNIMDSWNAQPTKDPQKEGIKLIVQVQKAHD